MGKQSCVVGWRDRHFPLLFLSFLFSPSRDLIDLSRGMTKWRKEERTLSPPLKGGGRKKKKKNRRESNRCCCVKKRRGKGVTRGLVCRKEPFFELFAVGSWGKEGKCFFFVPYACVQEEIMESYLFFFKFACGKLCFRRFSIFFPPAGNLKCGSMDISTSG